jgi:hypothetical protein
MEGLRIYFRQHQLVDTETGSTNVVVDCSGPVAAYVPGNVPNHNWVDMTEYTEGLENLQLSWDSVNQSSASSATNAAGSNYDKGISLDLVFSDAAFQYIWDWLLINKCQILNAIDVRIYDVICNKNYRLFEIKCDNLSYQPYDDSCRIECKLREQDLVWHCIHKTMIWDNHQNWFNQTGTSTKAHPTFVTCIEPRPRLLNSVRVALVFFIHSNPAINLIDFITNGNIKDDIRRILELNNFTPAPLIRDYIDNVAAKCGLATDTIFHRTGTPEYNACIFHSESGQKYENDGDDETSPSTKFIFENRWSVTLAELLDKLKLLYCAEWYVTPNNTIVFKPIAELINLAPIYDFTTGSLNMEGLKYTFSGDKKAAYGRYQYQQDGSDLGSQEISNLYNDITDYDGPTNNPMLEGEKNKSFEFAPTAFVRDGRTADYIRVLINDGESGAYILLAVLAIIIVVLFAGTVTAIAAVALVAAMAAWAIAISGKANHMRSHFTDPDGTYTGAVRLVSGNQTMMPRVLIWDGAALNKAKVVKTNNPSANSYYNPTSVPYTSNNSIGNNNPSNNVFNYPLYFDSKYNGNMFHRFHDVIDNSLKSLETNQSFEFTTDLCCSAVDLFGLWESDFVKIGYLLKLEQRTGYDVFGRIEHIEVSYKDYSIKLQGKVIKK